jgi:signal transduction histidine kinase
LPFRHTILVVDDEPDVIQNVQDLLSADFRVLAAANAADALRCLRQDTVHIVMTDQRLSDTPGVEFLHRLHDEYPHVVRLLFTAFADLGVVIDAINQGRVYRYITKPWKSEELISVVRQAAERFDLLAERKRLAGELKARNLDLESALARLRESDQLKTAFIQVASHELRTPLAILRGVAHLAGTVGPIPPAGRDYIRRIGDSAERLGRLVDQLVKMLSLNRIGKPLDRRPTDLTALLAAAADDVRPFAELRKQTLTVDLSPNLGEADIDPAQIRDAVNQLLLNAIKFTPDGGAIGLSAGRADGQIVLSVTDTGIGLDAETRERMFEPFFTSFDVSRHASGQFEFNRRGLGLGLSIVKEFIDLHGGTIHVDSEPGKGTTITIGLPA